MVGGVAQQRRGGRRDRRRRRRRGSRRGGRGRRRASTSSSSRAATRSARVKRAPSTEAWRSTPRSALASSSICSAISASTDSGQRVVIRACAHGAHHLGDEQRAAVRALRDRRRDVRGQRRVLGQLLRRAAAPRPARAAPAARSTASLGRRVRDRPSSLAVGDDEQPAPLADAAGDVADQRRGGLVHEVGVVDDDQRRVGHDARRAAPRRSSRCARRRTPPRAPRSRASAAGSARRRGRAAAATARARGRPPRPWRAAAARPRAPARGERAGARAARSRRRPRTGGWRRTGCTARAA